MLLFLLLVLGVESTPVQVGQIWVAAPTNATIMLDGRLIGFVAYGAGGFMLTNVPAGQHTVTVRAEKGSVVVSRIIEVKALQTYELVVPALSLYQRSRFPSNAGDVRLTSVNRRCTVTIGGSRHEMTSRTLTLKNLATGSYDMAALCGQTEMKGRIDIKGDHTTIVEIDARGPVVRVVGEQPRTPRINVPPPLAERVPESVIAADRRRAISAVFDSAVYEFSILTNTGSVITATFRCASAKTAAVLTERLLSRPEVDDVNVSSIEEVTGGVFVRLKITFVQP